MTPQPTEAGRATTPEPTAAKPLPLGIFALWLAQGERGLSSEAIVSRLTGVRVGRDSWVRTDYPHDPSDFRRCVLLLRQVPQAAMWFPIMREVSPVWAQLVDHWDELVALAEQEAPGVFEGRARGQAAPVLFDRMRELIEAGRAEARSS